MKKILLFLFCGVVLLSTSCTKEETSNCNCGMIMDDRVSDYSILIKNSCTGNQKWFTLQRGDWMNAHVGTRYCITNSGKW